MTNIIQISNLCINNNGIYDYSAILSILYKTISNINSYNNDIIVVITGNIFDMKSLTFGSNSITIIQNFLIKLCVIVRVLIIPGPNEISFIQKIEYLNQIIPINDYIYYIRSSQLIKIRNEMFAIFSPLDDIDPLINETNKSNTILVTTLKNDDRFRKYMNNDNLGLYWDHSIYSIRQSIHEPDSKIVLWIKNNKNKYESTDILIDSLVEYSNIDKFNYGHTFDKIISNEPINDIIYKLYDNINILNTFKQHSIIINKRILPNESKIHSKIIDLHKKLYFNNINIDKTINQWKLKSLTFQGLFCHKEQVKICFNQLNSIIGLIGLNNTGKSSVLDVLIFILFNKIIRGSYRSICNKDSTEFNIMVEICIDNNKILKICRNCLLNKKSSKTKQKVQIFINDKELMLTSSSITDTYKIINQYIGSYDIFIYTSVILQNNNQFNWSFCSSKDRKKIILKLLKLNKWQEVHQIIHKKLSKLKNNNTINVKDLDVCINNECKMCLYIKQNNVNYLINDNNNDDENILYKRYNEMMFSQQIGILDSLLYKIISYIVDNLINPQLLKYMNFTIKIDTTFDIFVSSVVPSILKQEDTDNYIIIEACSGYQRFVVSIIVKYIFSLISLLPKSNFICIDEGFDCIDDINIIPLKYLLKSIKANIDFVLIISHKEYLIGLMDIIIDIQNQKIYNL